MPPAAPEDGTMPSGREGVEAWRKLALRLLTTRNAELSRGGPPRLFVGRLPDDLPVEVPVPDGFTVVGGLMANKPIA